MALKIQKSRGIPPDAPRKHSLMTFGTHMPFLVIRTLIKTDIENIVKNLSRKINKCSNHSKIMRNNRLCKAAALPESRTLRGVQLMQ